MPQVVFVSTSNYQAPRDRVTEFLTSFALMAAVVAAGTAGWKSGGPLWGILLAVVTLVTFPFLLAFGTILFLAFYPWLVWPGTWLANRLGWTYSSPHAMSRIWLQRLSAVLILIPIVILIQRNAGVALALFAGMAAFVTLMVGMLILIPVLLLTALFFYGLSQSRAHHGEGDSFRWTPPDPPRLPPPT